MTDFVLKRYADMSWYMSLPWRIGLKLLSKAADNNRKETLFTIWANCYPNMGEDNWVSFPDFLKRNEPHEGQSTEQIMSGVKNIIEGMNHG